jgi:carbonic anhydrase/acetyltransferase-like protein (isoleucine patch superfamily)
MANPLRLTKGEAIAGKLISGSDIDSVGEVNVGTDLEVADDAYVTGAFGKGVAVTNIADGASMTFTAANLLSGIVTATPTEARNLQAPTASALITAVDADTETGLGFEFTVINLAANTHALTLTVNTGTTLIGSVTIAAASSATFVARLAATDAVVIYRK